MINANTQWQLNRDAQLCGAEDEQLVSIRAMIDASLADLHTCCPGIIDSFDAATQTVRVKPAIKKLLYPDNQAAEWVDLPVLVDVPVVTLSGKGYAITFPIEAGDECLILFCERAMDNWFEQGGASEQPHMRQHSLSDAFVLVGIRSRPNSITDYNTNAVELRSKDGNIRVQVSDEGIKLRAQTVTVEGDMVVTGSVRGEAGATFSGDVNGSGISLAHHTHGGVQGGGSTTGPPL